MAKTVTRKSASSNLPVTQDITSIAPSREDILLEENKKLQLEINRLNKQLESLRQPGKPIKLILSDEELIASTQLERIKFKAMEQELTLEEIRKFDLLVKNKKLAEGNPTMIADYKKLPEGISDLDLIDLASSMTKEDEHEED